MDWLVVLGWVIFVFKVIGVISLALNSESLLLTKTQANKAYGANLLVNTLITIWIFAVLMRL